ncbi:MAG TPA: hypothetical protein VFF04_03750 [Candidatus Babeliales bacterium]|nr:hypothetical protein [Candidatus Babeliales bacterium]
MPNRANIVANHLAPVAMALVAAVAVVSVAAAKNVKQDKQSSNRLKYQI